jgi:hypothetical protein
MLPPNYEKDKQKLSKVYKKNIRNPSETLAKKKCCGNYLRRSAARIRIRIRQVPEACTYSIPPFPVPAANAAGGARRRSALPPPLQMRRARDADERARRKRRGGGGDAAAAGSGSGGGLEEGCVGEREALRRCAVM